MTLLLAGCGTPTAVTRQGPATLSAPLARLDAAVRAVSATRARLLPDVSAVQAAATALDDADAVCATGDGVAARTAHRRAAPEVDRAGAAVGRLPADVTAYDTAVARLAASSGAVTGAARSALGVAVARARAEVGQARAFATAAQQVWPQYAALDGQETTWITRAVTPWYRSAQEGAAAYAVLVGDTRPALQQARAGLGRASGTLTAASSSTADALTAADRALVGLREAR